MVRPLGGQLRPERDAGLECLVPLLLERAQLGLERCLDGARGPVAELGLIELRLKPREPRLVL